MTVSERKGLGDGEGKTSIERRFAVGRRWAADLIQGARQAVYS